MTTRGWEKLGSVTLPELAAARVVLHWAAQIPGGAGATRIPAKKDFSHTNLGWHEEHRALMTHPIGDDGVLGGLRLATNELLVTSGADVLDRFALEGRTVRDGLAWMTETLDGRLADEVPLALPDHDMPAHALAEAGTFAAPSEACAEVGRWFANVDGLVRRVESAQGDRASETRVWPHHFDIATLITVEANDDPMKAKTVGVGMSPGDATYPDPYFYVTLWPRPEGDLPSLPAGRWHTEGWTGAVLGAAALLAAEDQGALATSFFEGGVETALALV